MAIKLGNDLQIIFFLIQKYDNQVMLSEKGYEERFKTFHYLKFDALHAQLALQ